MNVNDIFKRELDSIKEIPKENSYYSVVDTIYNCKGKCIFTGVGKAGSIAKLVCEKFNSIGIHSFFLDPLNSQHGDIGVLNDKDIIIMFSNSGETRELIEMFELVDKIRNDVSIILVTGKKESTLAKKATHVLDTGSNKEMIDDKSKPLGLVPTISTTLMSVIGDVLLTLLINKKNFSIDEYQYYHHSGYISKIIKES